MIVFSHNENEIDGFRVLSKEWGADVVSIKTAQIYDYECNSSLIPKTGKYSRYKYVGEKWEMKKKVRNRCWRAWNGAVINSDGEMLPCCFDKNSAYSYGNVFEEDICVLWNNERAREFRKQILKDRSSVEMCCNCDV